MRGYVVNIKRAKDVVPFLDWIWYNGRDHIVLRNNKTASGSGVLVLNVWHSDLDVQHVPYGPYSGVQIVDTGTGVCNAS